MNTNIKSILIQFKHGHMTLDQAEAEINGVSADVVGRSESFICDHCESECTDMSKEVVLHSKCYDKLLENK
jgi:hypothetical protein